MSVVQRAGFGFDARTKEIPVGHQMTFNHALDATLKDTYIRAGLPAFLWGNSEDRKAVRASGWAGKGYLGRRVQKTSIAYAEVKVRSESNLGHG
jgi:hypothetical protein